MPSLSKILVVFAFIGELGPRNVVEPALFVGTDPCFKCSPAQLGMDIITLVPFLTSSSFVPPFDIAQAKFRVGEITVVSLPTMLAGFLQVELTDWAY